MPFDAICGISNIRSLWESVSQCWSRHTSLNIWYHIVYCIIRGSCCFGWSWCVVATWAGIQRTKPRRCPWIRNASARLGVMAGRVGFSCWRVLEGLELRFTLEWFLRFWDETSNEIGEANDYEIQDRESHGIAQQLMTDGWHSEQNVGCLLIELNGHWHYVL